MHAVANSGQFMAGNCTIKLGILAGHNQSSQSLVFLLTQLHFGQWNSFQFCLPSLIVQWPTRIFHFQLLCMIVKLAYTIYYTILLFVHKKKLAEPVGP